MVYLFIGEDVVSKDIKLKEIKDRFLPPASRDFNFDVLYARDIDLHSLQEKVLTLPLKAQKRIIVIKDAHQLKDDIRAFILEYSRGKNSSAILILDITQVKGRDEFIGRLSRHAQVSRFRDSVTLDAFMLSRQVEAGRPDHALRILNQLLEDGEKPERIIGGLRYAWEKTGVGSLQTRKKLKALLNCDIDIKTGRLKPGFALEKLVIKLCSFSRVKPFV